MNRLRVLTLLPGITPDGGAERSTAMLLPRLASMGVDVHLGLLTDRQSLVPALEASGIVVHDLSTGTSATGRVRRIRSLLRTVPFDLVHATLFEATLPSQLAAALAGHPVLVTWATTSYGSASSDGEEVAQWKLQLAQCAEIAIARVARTKFHAVTQGVAEVNSARLHVHRERVAVGERGRNSESLLADAAEVAEVRRELGLDGHHRVVLAVGRQVPEKGHDTLIEAFDRVADASPDVWLLVAGREGSDSDRLRRLTDRARHRDRIRFLGQRSDVRVLLATADVVVCSSRREGAAGALIESMAAGTPIVTVPLEGLAGVILDGVNGVVVEPAELHLGIERILGDPAEAKALADRAKETFGARFTLDRSVARLAEIYRWAAASSG